ncbi:hypothetical protein K474DRAFT_1060565 [Panus rudis PR-1116 ss-1]|nr:hypothetical protein K474DRAFT_1060565 [Panus rudis PR-1116 ss-1]
MHVSALFTAFVALFASSALALNISFPGNAALTGIPCPNECQPALSAIAGCGDNNDACLCNNSTIQALTACEQCFFNELIHTFKVAPDPRADATPALKTYTDACNASLNTVVPASEFKITLPPDWDGPSGIGLNLAATVVTCIVTFGLGVSLIGVLVTM